MAQTTARHESSALHRDDADPPGRWLGNMRRQNASGCRPQQTRAPLPARERLPHRPRGCRRRFGKIRSKIESAVRRGERLRVHHRIVGLERIFVARCRQIRPQAGIFGSRSEKRLEERRGLPSASFENHRRGDGRRILLLRDDSPGRGSESQRASGADIAARIRQSGKPRFRGAVAIDRDRTRQTLHRLIPLNQDGRGCRRDECRQRSDCEPDWERDALGYGIAVSARSRNPRRCSGALR